QLTACWARRLYKKRGYTGQRITSFLFSRKSFKTFYCILKLRILPKFGEKPEFPHKTKGGWRKCFLIKQRGLFVIHLTIIILADFFIKHKRLFICSLICQF